MARPLKQGIDYFPLDVDMDSVDDRIFLMEADYGAEGFGVLIKLLMYIYQQHGYYLYWDDAQIKRFSKKKNIDYGLCKNVINKCINEGFFNQELYKKWRILSSRGIQKRFFEAMKRRSRVPLVREYLLLDLSEINEQIKEKIVYVNIKSINAHNNSVIVDNNKNVFINVDNNPVNVDKNGVIVDKCSTSVHILEQTRLEQSKLEESKEKESKENECSPSASPGVNTPSKKPTSNNQSRDGPLDTNQFGPDGKKLLSPEDVQQEKDRQKRALKGKYPDEFSDEELEVPPFFPKEETQTGRDP